MRTARFVRAWRVVRTYRYTAPLNTYRYLNPYEYLSVSTGPREEGLERNRGNSQMPHAVDTSICDTASTAFASPAMNSVAGPSPLQESIRTSQSIRRPCSRRNVGALNMKKVELSGREGMFVKYGGKPWGVQRALYPVAVEAAAAICKPLHGLRPAKAIRTSPRAPS